MGSTISTTTSCQPTRLTTTQGITLSWLSSRCLLPAPWNIDCHQCRDACPEQALAVVASDEGPWLIVSDACTNCHECLPACDTEALMAPPATLSRRALFRRAASPAPLEVDFADSGPAPRRRWRQEALANDGQRLHPSVFVDTSRCDASGLCSQLCPSSALQANASGALMFNSHDCLGCGKCESVCPNQAIGLEEPNAPFQGILRQAERRECSECGHEFQQVNDGSESDEDWSQLPLCPACQRDQALMKNDVMPLFR
ncbi:4Fe-4S binding protein [Marinobacter sp. ATCH36]|uniref:4Fe-4S binding protein n=1 Tax=Marinobacter sp. ATCH36 TaxID=2945106 RepID=UPI00202127AC|nr:4Fe-4S binding protein [Marinobacter sp. ATCH36]MCL7943056.1 4Fe-4S binding protein [Marinobacter sp. ATCH36]